MSISRYSLVLLDACVTINLAASGVPLEDYCAALSIAFAMTDLAAAEALYLPADDGDLPDIGPEVVEIGALAAQGGLSIVRLSEAEVESFVGFASQVDDGEASTLAVARHRQLCVATDDRKARRLAASLDPPIDLLGTTEILRQWGTSQAERSERMPEVIRRIERRASFIPRRDDPHFEWWVRLRGDPS